MFRVLQKNVALWRAAARAARPIHIPAQSSYRSYSQRRGVDTIKLKSALTTQPQSYPLAYQVKKEEYDKYRLYAASAWGVHDDRYPQFIPHANTSRTLIPFKTDAKERITNLILSAQKGRINLLLAGSRSGVSRLVVSTLLELSGAGDTRFVYLDWKEKKLTDYDDIITILHGVERFAQKRGDPVIVLDSMDWISRKVGLFKSDLQEQRKREEFEWESYEFVVARLARVYPVVLVSNTRTLPEYVGKIEVNVQVERVLIDTSGCSSKPLWVPSDKDGEGVVREVKAKDVFGGIVTLHNRFNDLCTSGHPVREAYRTVITEESKKRLCSMWKVAKYSGIPLKDVLYMYKRIVSFYKVWFGSGQKYPEVSVVSGMRDRLGVKNVRRVLELAYDYGVLLEEPGNQWCCNIVGQIDFYLQEEIDMLIKNANSQSCEYQVKDHKKRNL